MQRAVLASRWIEHLQAHRRAARLGDDPEGVHQVRVAAARLDVWLRMGAWRVLRDDLRWLRRSAGPVRDLDVVRERRLPAEFDAWVRRSRDEQRPALVQALDSPRLTATLEALARLAPLPRPRAGAFVAKCVEGVRRRGRRAGRASSSLAELHALRRALRRLRYARDWIELDSTELKALQEELGALNDTSITLALLERSPLVDQFPEWRQELVDDVRQRMALARVAWRSSKLAENRRKP